MKHKKTKTDTQHDTHMHTQHVYTQTDTHTQHTQQNRLDGEKETKDTK